MSFVYFFDSLIHFCLQVYLRATAAEAGIVIYYCILYADDILPLVPFCECTSENLACL